MTDKAYCWYDDDIENKNTYGALYTWAGAMNCSASSALTPSGVQGVCPTGWHLPSDDEWASLITSSGGINIAGAKLKESGSVHWISPNYEATNETGFTALPGGRRNHLGYCFEIRNFGYWWSST